MKTKYKYIHFVQKYQKVKTPSVWNCVTNRDDVILGQVMWCSAWKEYCFFPQGETFYSKGCLMDIIHFMDQLND